MNRRDFLTAAAAGAASIAMPNIIFSQPSRPKAKIVRLAEDHFEIICDSPSKFRILQITDTHFGSPTPGEKLTDAMSKTLIRNLVDEQKPDFVFHTGDFINNDKENVDLSAIGYMNDLGTPWSLVFGNHDHSDGQKGGISLDDYYSRLENHAMGYHTAKDSVREYCFRIDIRSLHEKPATTLIGFNCGGASIPKIVSAGQTKWLQSQLEMDAKKGLKQPILVMQHIPTINYKELFDSKTATGRRGENECFELDHGDIFKIYRDSSRVKGVFCGHDHVNDYIGNREGVRLAYGRVTGWSGYGDWQRGGRIIELEDSPKAFKSRVVLRKGAKEKAEWQSTLTDN